MDRDLNRQEPTTPGLTNRDVATEADVRRSMIMARDVGVAHPEMVENLSVLRPEKVEPFGQDLVHWGSIWGGFFAYVACASILSALAISVGAIRVAPTTVPPPAGQVVATVGITAGIIMLLSCFVGGLLGGWTSNLRSRWPCTVNGLFFASLVIAAPVLLALGVALLTASGTAAATANAAALRGGVFMPGGFAVDARTLDMIASNVGWFSLGSILLLIVGALGYYAGMRAHLNDLGIKLEKPRQAKA